MTAKKTAGPGDAPAAKGGRPRNPTAPRSEDQVTLKIELDQCLEELKVAHTAYKLDRSTAARLRYMHCRVDVAGAWSSYLQAQNNHTWAMRYDEIGLKFHAQITAVYDLEMNDQVRELAAARAKREARRKGRPT